MAMAKNYTEAEKKAIYNLFRSWQRSRDIKNILEVNYLDICNANYELMQNTIKYYNPNKIY